MRLILCLSMLFLLACKKDGGGSSSTPAVTWTVSGQVTYDDVPITNSGLNYAQTTQKPARRVYLEVIRDSDQTVLAKTYTSEEGRYQVKIPINDLNKDISVLVWAKMQSPKVVVLDNTNSDAEYVAQSPTIHIEGSTRLDPINMQSGWDGTSYTGVRAAAPFAILNSIYSATKKIASVRPKVSYPPLTVYWSENNLAVDGDISLGEIGTSFYNDSALYILGKADNDTDEYDKHVIVHEWGHYFEDQLGRSDSLGGPHASGDLLDRTVAMGEGWGNAISGIVWDPEIVYRDSYGLDQEDIGVEMNLETSDDIYPGWYSEVSVQEILFDLYQEIGLGPMIDVMMNHQKKTPAIVSIFSFLNGLKINNPQKVTKINAIAAAKGIDPVMNDHGSTQTDQSGLNLSWLYPVVQGLVVGGPELSVQMGGWAYNAADNNAYFRFTATSFNTAFDFTSSDSYYLGILSKGEGYGEMYEDATDGNGFSHSFTFETLPGREYIFRVGVDQDALFDPNSPVIFKMKVY